MESTGMAYYLALLASEAFYTHHARWPGDGGVTAASDDDSESAQQDLQRDTEAVLERVHRMLKEIGWTEEVPGFVSDCVGEV
jgi:hypothetical protein